METGRSPKRRRLTLPPSPQRFPGDGYDYRRPVTSNSSTMPNVVDLTDDDDTSASLQPTAQAEVMASSSRASRLPRYDREIIDLSADDVLQNNLQHPSLPRQDSPDVEFVASRPLSRPASRLQQRRQTPSQSQPSGNHVSDLTVDQDEDVVHLRTESRNGINNRAPNGAAGRIRAAVDQTFGVAANVQRISEEEGARFGGGFQQGRLFQRMFGGPLFVEGTEDFDEPPHRPNVGGPIRPHRRTRNQDLPVIMDYHAIGFDLGMEPRRPPTPKYEPPPPAPEGFTRSPEDNQEIVCPNCGDELATGPDEEKRQVWIVKNCGHTYCGSCMVNRQRKTQKAKGKGKEKVTDAAFSKPFSKCVVDGCGAGVSTKKQVLQIFI